MYEAHDIINRLVKPSSEPYFHHGSMELLLTLSPEGRSSYVYITLEVKNALSVTFTTNLGDSVIFISLLYV